MSKFNTFTASNVKTLRSELQAVLDKYSVVSNVKLTVDGIRYGSDTCNIKVSAKVLSGTVSASGVQVSKELDIMARITGLTLEARNGRRLTDYKSRNTKYPFIYTQAGRSYKCSEMTAKSFFKN